MKWSALGLWNGTRQRLFVLFPNMYARLQLSDGALDGYALASYH